MFNSQAMFGFKMADSIMFEVFVIWKGMNIFLLRAPIIGRDRHISRVTPTWRGTLLQLGIYIIRSFRAIRQIRAVRRRDFRIPSCHISTKPSDRSTLHRWDWNSFQRSAKCSLPMKNHLCSESISNLFSNDENKDGKSSFMLKAGSENTRADWLYQTICWLRLRLLTTPALPRWACWHAQRV